MNRIISLLFGLLLTAAPSRAAGDASAPFFAPLLDETGPLTLSGDEQALRAQRGDVALILFHDLPPAEADGYHVDGRFLPQFDAGRWGYADEIVYGRLDDTLIGLSLQGTVSDPEQVRKLFEPWFASLDSTCLPVLPEIASARIEPIDSFSLMRECEIIRHLCRILPDLGHVYAQFGARNRTGVVQLYGMPARDTSSPCRIMCRIDSRPPSMTADYEANEIAPGSMLAFTLATPEFAVRVEVSRGDLVIGDLAGWRARLRELLRP